MTDLIRQIQIAQRNAGEAAVISHLGALGLADRCEADATPPKTNPLNRATDLHEKAAMPWAQAEKLALEEEGIGNTEIDELIGNASSHAIIGLLDDEEVREFVRSILVYHYALKPNTNSATRVE